MDMRTSRLLLVATGLLALVVAVPSLLPDLVSRDPVPRRPRDTRALRAAYDRWKAAYTEADGARTLRLPLRHAKGLSAGFVKARGEAVLDLTDGGLRLRVDGLPRDAGFDVWLVDNQSGPGRSVRPEPGDRMQRVGRLRSRGGASTLETRLERRALEGFEIDLVVVARAGQDPTTGGVLYGAPTLFHRLYYREGQAGARADHPTVPAAAPWSVLVPRPAWAGGGDAGLVGLVERGARLFFDETFQGNGRTCATCHPAENNFTLDPKFIARLPRRDPLFVAEFNPDLAGLENPVLMRRFGLILENVDGLEDPTNKFVMRGVPHTLGLPNSLTPANDGTPRPPLQRTGWSGDGAPGAGTLRDFATGAVVQHFTRTLNRTPGVDFRLPTDDELDAMEAFQLSLGRQEELDLGALVFTSPAVQLGQTLFLTTARCNACHANAGANASFGGGGNRNFNTGVEDLPSHPADATGEPRPRDGGFGTVPDGLGGFGDGTFNTPSLVEAADTAPFFHNNAVKTLEEAVAFYTSPSFNSSPAAAAGRINLTEEEVDAVAALLRVLNALDNIRSASGLLEEARDAGRFAEARAGLQAAIGETGDAIRVLSERGLHPRAVKHLVAARALALTASRVPLRFVRNFLVGRALEEHAAARADMVM
jgi:hypothetical protein